MTPFRGFEEGGSCGGVEVSFRRGKFDGFSWEKFTGLCESLESCAKVSSLVQVSAARIRDFFQCVHLANAIVLCVFKML